MGREHEMQLLLKPGAASLLILHAALTQMHRRVC